ncbi:hypothetical protein BGZ68_004326 [Mortierella alpina]|nr:hypothetical protein BGZ68_004326 [Mortierella alpina]
MPITSQHQHPSQQLSHPESTMSPPPAPMSHALACESLARQNASITTSTTTTTAAITATPMTPQVVNPTAGSSLSIDTSPSSTSPSFLASRSHAYWSGFYKKTIKERRTQLGLAFPHLTRPSSLEAFASAQTSAKTSGQSTPNLGPVPRPVGMSTLLLPTPSSPSPSSSTSSSSCMPMVMPRPVQPMYRTTSASLLQNNNTAIALHLNDTSLRTASPLQHEVPLEDGSLLNYTEEQHDEKAAAVATAESSAIRSEELGLSSPLQQPSDSNTKKDRAQDGEQEDRVALDLELSHGQRDEDRTEEERRDQLEKERKATVILNLEEQRKMIGSPNGHLLEGDLSLDARLDAIIATEQEGKPFPIYGLDEQIANNMIENCIGTLGLPLGLAFNFTINGSPMVIPMAIEEPSVIAAVSSAAKTISTYQGFQAYAPERNMIVAQVQLLDIPDTNMDRVVAKMLDQEKLIRDEANEYCSNMVLRGGGVQRISLHRIRRHQDRDAFQGQNLLIRYGVISPQSVPSRLSTSSSSSSSQGMCSEMLVVHLHIDVGDAMGANCANTVAEGIAPFLAKMSSGRVGVRILSNLNVDRIAKSLPGKDVVVRILEAFEWAELDPYRAATHNKGIMNGIDAVALACGQDWRAIEAGAHAWASGAGTHSDRSRLACKRKASWPTETTHDQIHRGDSYKPLTRYWIEEDETRIRQGFKGQDALVFCGELEMPIMVGTKGGVLSTNPVHAFTLGVMRYPNSKQLAMAMVTVGLAQNFAALRALVTEGIQRGHMALHARNIAMSAGTPPASVDEVTAHMIDTGKIRLGAARSYIEKRGLGFYGSGMNANGSSINIENSGSMMNGSSPHPTSCESDIRTRTAT